MADTITFNEGKTELANNGLPATCYFLLSSKDCATHVATDTLGGGVGEVTYWTGGGRTSEAEPTASSGAVSFAQKSWSTGAHVDGPATCKSVVLVTTSDNTGKAIAAWNIQAGGTNCDMSIANATINFTPTLTLS